jgi:purine-binding chemotaxis protein CheW
MTITTESGPRAASFAGGKFLSFQLSKEEYGFDILKVREIIGVVDVTALPNTPAHVRGVLNLRGRIIPVVDLRQRFGMPSAEFTAETCIVVVDSGDESESSFRVGCIVDSVREVLSVDPDHFEGPPRCASGADAFVAGLAKLEDRVLILLDIAQVIGDIDPAALPKDSAE